MVHLGDDDEEIIFSSSPAAFVETSSNFKLPHDASTIKNTSSSDKKKPPVMKLKVDLDERQKLVVLVEESIWNDRDPDFGGLVITPRVRKNDDDARYEEERDAFLTNMDVPMDNNYDKFDEVEHPRDCVRPAWTDLVFCNCNHFHENLAMDVHPDERKTYQRYDVRYLASGHFRDGFLLRDRHQDINTVTADESSSFVLKQWRLDWYLEFDQDAVDRVRREALIMERLSASPKISNIYGYCAVSTMVQTLRDVDQEIVPLYVEYQEKAGHISFANLSILQEQRGAYSLNNFTVEEKLDMALDMAEGLAEMHGYEGSVILNHDVLPRQWLMNANNRMMVLNDNNYAIFLEWNEKKQDYCKVRRFTGGDLRSPQEFDGIAIDESADVYSFGGVIYCLLMGKFHKASLCDVLSPYAHSFSCLTCFVGLVPHFDIPRNYRAKLEQRALDGERPYVDPRIIANGGFIEQRLLEIVDRCHVVDPTERVTIFEVVKFLRETKELHQQQEQKKRLVMMQEQSEEKTESLHEL
jgi:serine/threonine protein kinase